MTDGGRVQGQFYYNIQPTTSFGAKLHTPWPPS